VDDLQRQSERALSEEIVIDIHKQTSILKKLATVAIDEEGARSLHDELGVLRKLATGAIDEDGAHSLPILEREVLQLLNYFRYRQGPFIAATGPTGVVRDDADQGAHSSSGLAGAEKA
jgi:hypothetical protein